ncbi:carboxymuconolactone decarboxylase family protein [Archangium violaceum]|uniref:carboxymuconolactone decarboxylase family protein n=1 Tax=Archangium violaceum TaxID=83451 RepID=UPI00193C7232|nr:carboxymuconolactone decarboxylase family protein [Archangium violaceum]QRK09680.1 carboxymuconolactone decarboxylase family protein [Archangium violaceum]
MPNPHARQEWADFKRIAPAANAAILALGQAVGQSGLEKDLLELVKLRASQINGCAFCVQYHLNIARTLEVPQPKLDLLAVWRDAGVFSERERAALEWTELLTDIAGQEVSDEAYAAVSARFSDTELAFLTTAIGTINVWNRIGIAFRFSPPLPQQTTTGGAA